MRWLFCVAWRVKGGRTRWGADRCGERTERCRWQRKRSERVAAVKIFSVRRKTAQKFWAPQQGHRALRKRHKECDAGEESPSHGFAVTAPFRQGGHGDGGTDCHGQCSHWPRNDILQEVQWSVAHMGAALQGFCRAGPACPAVGAGKIRFGPMLGIGPYTKQGDANKHGRVG